MHGTLQRPHTARSKPITTSRLYHNFESWGGDSNGSLEPWVPKRFLGHCGQSQHSTTFDNWALLVSIVATCRLNDVNPVAYLAETLRRHHQRPSADPDRGTHALAIPENVKPKSIGDPRGAYEETPSPNRSSARP
ncbi:MAG TPA: transposase domain-containing protein [Pseudaminobacter sp.]|nr:transposase domain-containing protein [Pseudaminobacter sp.]